MLVSRKLVKGVNFVVPKGPFEGNTGSCRAYPGKGALQALGTRRNVVKVIQKITGTMKLVAQAQLLGVIRRAKEVSPFYTNLKSFTDTFSKTEESNDEKKRHILLITTNRGLCGSLNSQLVRDTFKMDIYPQCSLIIVGEKGTSILEKKAPHNLKVIASAHPSRNVNFSDFSCIASELMKLSYDEIIVVFNKMITNNSFALSQIVIPSRGYFESQASVLPYEYEENHDELFENFAEFYAAASLHYALSENTASETLSRRNAMDNANKNCKELGFKLSIVFNKLRQALITTDLIEITAGVVAVEEMQ